MDGRWLVRMMRGVSGALFVRGDAPSLASFDEFPRVEVWGLSFTDAPSIERVADKLLAGHRSDADRLPLVLTPNVDILVTLEDSPELTDLVNRCDIVLADGQPLVWLSRAAGGRLTTRLTGADLAELLWAGLRDDERPVAVIAPSSEIAERLEHQHTQAVVVVAPILDDASAIEEYASEVAGRTTEGPTPEFVLSGLGFPKDALLGEALIRNWPPGRPVPMVLGVGGSLAFLAGAKRRAPMVLRRYGLEFLHRLASEPRRLGRRYLVRDARFALIAWRRIRSTRREAAARRAH